jgi:RNA recognition motif-containing protein
MNIYVGSLSDDVKEDQLLSAFEAYGHVDSANIIKDRFSGESRGFGFVEMSNKEEAKAAIAALNGSQMNGKSIVVNEARPKKDNRDSRGGGRNKRHSSGGGGFGGNKRRW